MLVYGHRGARGLVAENTLRGFKTASAVGVDGLEVDVRLTKDGVLMLLHDRSFARVAGVKRKISDLTAAEVKAIKIGGEAVPTLEQSLAATKLPVLLDCKGHDWAEPLSNFLKKRKPKNIHGVVSFNLAELRRLQKLQPTMKLYLINNWNPFSAVWLARKAGLAGVDLAWWIVNPLTYWQLKRRKMDLLIYRVDFKWLAWLMNLLYPGATSISGRPDRLQFLRSELKK